MPALSHLLPLLLKLGDGREKSGENISVQRFELSGEKGAEPHPHYLHFLQVDSNGEVETQDKRSSEGDCSGVLKP